MFSGSHLLGQQPRRPNIPGAQIQHSDYVESRLGQQEHPRVFRWQYNSGPQELGTTQVFDSLFARTTGEPWQPDHLGLNRIPMRDEPAPLWAEPELRRKQKMLEYKNNFLTHGSNEAEMRLSRVALTHAPPQITNRSLVSIVMEGNKK